jgi:hypothetical protein
MFGGGRAPYPDRRSDEHNRARTLPWQFVLLLLGFLALTVALAILHPAVFGAPFEEF